MKKLLLLTVFCSIFLAAKAQVSPTANGTILVCEGGNITIPTSNSGESYEISYSSTQTTNPTIGVTLTNSTTIPTTNGTGYYYIAVKNTTTNCISDWQEVAVYVLKPLEVSISTNNNELCVEDTGTDNAKLTGTITNPESTSTVITLAYQWYTVSASNNETKIDDANTADYTIPTSTSIGDHTYRLKVGYVIGGNKYCSVFADKAIEILPKPTTPTITITGNTAETW